MRNGEVTDVLYVEYPVCHMDLLLNLQVRVQIQVIKASLTNSMKRCWGTAHHRSAVEDCFTGVARNVFWDTSKRRQFSYSVR
jgi:hypothetical protein